MPSKTIIAAANELMNGINSQKTRLKKVEDINTLLLPPPAVAGGTGELRSPTACVKMRR